MKRWGVYVTLKEEGFLQSLAEDNSPDIGTVGIETDELKVLVGTLNKYPFGQVKRCAQKDQRTASKTN